MVNYQNSKIYIIKTDINNLVYIGATTELYLSTRFQKHKSQKCSINNYINNPLNNTKWEDWYIELYENYPCKDKNELNKKEGEIQKLFKNDNSYILINKKITNKSKTETNKEWREKNKELLKQYSKEHKDKNVERCNNYYHKNQKKILEQKSEKVVCECGFIGVRGNSTQHKKTKKHLQLMEKLSLAVECSTPSVRVEVVSFDNTNH